MQEIPLFVGVAEAIALTAVYDVPDGWRVMLTVRRQGEDWRDSYRVDYSHLTSSELAEVVCAELWTRLELA